MIKIVFHIEPHNNSNQKISTLHMNKNLALKDFIN